MANPRCMLVVTPTGGHLGWASGAGGVRGAPWSDAPLGEYVAAVGKMLAREETRRGLAAPGEPAGVYTVETGVHQAP